MKLSKEKWFKQLAQDKPLNELAQSVPHGYQASSGLLQSFMQDEVPVLRATWFLKITHLNKQKLKRTESKEIIRDWTKLLVINMKELLKQSAKDLLRGATDRSLAFTFTFTLTSILTSTLIPTLFRGATEKHELQTAQAWLAKWSYLMRLADWEV